MAPLPRPNPDEGGISLLESFSALLTPRVPSSRASDLFDSAPQDLSSLLKRHPPALPNPKAERDTNQLSVRQSSALIPENYTNRNSGPSPGTVVGIVLGSVAGFLLILWLLYTCFGGGGSIFPSNESEGSVVIRERKRSHKSHSRRASETVEVRSSRAPPVERIIVTEERRERRTSRPVESSISDSGEDEVVVIEEHSPPRRAKSKRESGYRTVDPLAYGGGDRPMRKVSSSRRSRG